VLDCRSEERTEDRAWRMLGERAQLARQREDDMEVPHREQPLGPRGDPLLLPQGLALGAVPVAAGIVGHADRPAGAAALDMAAELGGPAQLDRAHGATFDASETAVMSVPIRIAMAAEDVRHLQLRRHGREPDQPGGTTSMFSRSSGPVVRRRRPFETLV